MRISNKWIDYECIDAGNMEKIDRFGNVILRRPEPQAIWASDKLNNIKVDAIYHRSDKGGGYWDFKNKIKDNWIIKYGDLKFKVSPTSFKHTGIFPEQAVNWDFIINKVKTSNRPIKVLNLFAYTGGATMAASLGGAVEVVHVDASKGMVEWAKDNVKLSNLENNKIRFIIDDCLKFVLREQRRGNKYDAIIMDPPSYGRGPDGELWKLEDNLNELIEACMNILSDEPLFFIINVYATGISINSIHNLLKLNLENKYAGSIEVDELGLPITQSSLLLSCGISGRWECD